MKIALSVLRRPAYVGMVIVVTALLTWLYYSFSLRSAGEHTTIFTRTYATPDFEIKTFGAAYFYAGVALDVILAFLTAVPSRYCRRIPRDTAWGCLWVTIPTAASTFWPILEASYFSFSITRW